MEQGRSLYERIGGEAAVMAAVDLFYRKVLADPRIKHFFEALDMPAQVQKQVAFMSRAFGGPLQYQGRDLREAHKDLVAKKGLTDAHFDAVAEHLNATLVELKVPADVIQDVMALVGGTRKDVLSR